MATRGINHALDSRLERAVPSQSQHEVTNMTDMEPPSVSTTPLLPVEILASTGLIDHKAATNTHSPARSGKSRRLGEDEVVCDAASAKKCGKMAEDSEVYSMEEEDIRKVTSLGGVVIDKMECIEPTVPPPQRRYR